ncbi:TrmH family RNA methyltransferase [Nitratifractor sp.]
MPTPRIVEVTDIDTEALAPYRTLRGNRFEEDGGFVADSPRVVGQLLGSGLRFKSVLCTPEYFRDHESQIRAAGVPVVYLADKRRTAQIVGHTVHHGVMAHVVRPPETPLEKLPDRIVMLTRLNNMENVGAIARSAVALGVHGYVVPAAGPHPFGRRAIRVSTGHVIHMALHRYEDPVETIQTLRRLGYTIVAAESCAGAIPLCDTQLPSSRWVLILGNEEEGIAPEILRRCDAIVEIEMEEGIKSFNVSAAAAIVLYRLRHCTRKGG